MTPSIMEDEKVIDDLFIEQALKDSYLSDVFRGAMREFLERYEAARMAAFPADSVRRIEQAIDDELLRQRQRQTGEAFWADSFQLAQAVLTAMEPVPAPAVQVDHLAATLCKWRNGKHSDTPFSELPDVEQEAYREQARDALAVMGTQHVQSLDTTSERVQKNGEIEHIPATVSIEAGARAIEQRTCGHVDHADAELFALSCADAWDRKPMQPVSEDEAVKIIRDELLRTRCFPEPATVYAKAAYRALAAVATITRE
jgi:hypothetical protein